MPHGQCYFWSEDLIALHVISDALIVAAYYSIPFTLVYFVRRRRDIEFHWMFVCFAVFIMACGTTHLLEIWNIWHANYWLSGGIKALTALASVPTAILLVKLVPQALALPSATQLHTVNTALQGEIVERKLAEARLREFNEELETRVQERTAELDRSLEALRVSEERFRLVVEAAPNAMVVADEHGHMILVNAQAEKLFGYARAELLGQPVELLVPERYRPAHVGYRGGFFQHPQARAMGAGRDLFGRRKDGGEVPVEIGLNPVHTAEGACVLASIIDITERRQAEAALRDSQQLLRAIVDNSSAVIYVKDLQGRYLMVNRRYEEIFQLPSDAILGKTDHDLFSREAADAFRAVDQRVVVAGHALTEEETAPQADGPHHYISVKSVLRDNTGKVCAMFGISTDISEHKAAEGKLKASLKEIGDLKAALDEHAIVAITDPQGKITYVNDRFCAISKYARSELLGQDHRLINSNHHPKEFIRELWATITHGRVWHGEIKNKAKDGTFYWVDTTIVPFLNEQGKPRHYVAIRADITERKTAEETILKLNTDLEQRVTERTVQLETANRELEAFSYSVSHDLRAPLRAIDGFSQAVVEDYGPQLPEEARRYLRTIRGGAQQMGALIDDLLTFSRLSRQPVKKHEVNMTKLVRAVLEELTVLQQGRLIDVRVGPLPVCRGDPILLKQVWVNLLSNALKYTRKRERAEIEIGCRTTNGVDTFFVRDNGTGFDMRYADKLFGVFQRLHRMEDYEGTGVGLAIVQRVINRHGGRIWAEAMVDQGATFNFTVEGETKL